MHQALEEAMMSSQVIMGNSKSEEDQMKKQMLLRQSAWCLMLGIDFGRKEFSNFETVFFETLVNNKAENDTKHEKGDVLYQIKLDVNRTFRSFNLKFLSSDPGRGKNKLYNLLKVYALILDPEIGYTQGMNFIAALILMHVPNQALACRIFTQVLEKDKWARMYHPETPKLFELS